MSLMFSKNTTTKCFFYPNVSNWDWWFVLEHDLGSKHLLENNNVLILSDEDNQGDGNEE